MARKKYDPKLAALEDLAQTKEALLSRAERRLAVAFTRWQKARKSYRAALGRMEKHLRGADAAPPAAQASAAGGAAKKGVANV